MAFFSAPEVSLSSSVQLHFAHANGFPAGSYKKLFSYLPAHWQILAKPQFGHDSELPVNSNWSNQAEELHRYVYSNSAGAPVYAVGHSFGAVISFIAACRYPASFKGVILIDPPLVTGPKRHIVKAAKLTSYIDKITPARLAQNRNTQWSADEDLVAYFKGKALFKNMQPECVADYVESATAVDGNQQTLTFDAQVEADIFRNIPHNMDSFKGELNCPGVLITGQQSEVCKEEHWQRFISQNDIVHEEMPGGHMLPLEHPKELAGKIAEIIASWEKQSGSRSA